MRKTDVRRIAAEAAIERTPPRESQDVCFLSGGDLHTFLDRHITNRDGDVVDMRGRVLGRHGGISRYTVGQRRGLGIAGAEPLYVKRIDAADNRIVLAPVPELFARTVRCRNVKFRSRSTVRPLTAKIRYRHPAAGVASVTRKSGVLTVVFDTPQRAPAPGQSLVLYRDDVVMGGGIIEDSDGDSVT
jgi:tRNA-specific 2-thiouridylase